MAFLDGVPVGRRHLTVSRGSTAQHMFRYFCVCDTDICRLRLTERLDEFIRVNQGKRSCMLARASFFVTEVVLSVVLSYSLYQARSIIVLVGAQSSAHGGQPVKPYHAAVAKTAYLTTLREIEASVGDLFFDSFVFSRGSKVCELLLLRASLKIGSALREPRG